MLKLIALANKGYTTKSKLNVSWLVNCADSDYKLCFSPGGIASWENCMFNF